MSIPTPALSAARKYPPEPRSEPHWPPQLAVLVAIALQVLLPSRLTPGPRWLFPALEAAMLLALVLASPQRVVAEHAPRRRLAVIMTAVVSLANAGSLALLVHQLFRSNISDGRPLVISGGLIWLTNVLLFSLWYWEVDRGGPGRRAAGHDGPPDFLFPQMTGIPGVASWRPQFLDYLYVSLTNAAAFSPTDTMPLSHAAKSLMGLQSMISLLTIGLVVSRAVNIL